MGGVRLVHGARLRHRLALLLVISSSLQVLAAPAASDPYMFSRHEGYIAGGGDIKSEYTTVTHAKALCRGILACTGFTFMGGPAEGPMWINFKDEWNVGGTGWTSYHRELKPGHAHPAPAAPAAPEAEPPREAASATADTTPPGEPVVIKVELPAESPVKLSAEGSSKLDELAGSISDDYLPLGGTPPAVETTSSHGDQVSLESIPQASPDVGAVDASTPGTALPSETPPNDAKQAQAQPETQAPVPTGLTQKQGSTLQAPVNAYVQETVAASAYQDSLFVGTLMSMQHRAVRALGLESVVMCYAHQDTGGACRVARHGNETERLASAAPSDASANDTRLLPPLAWGTAEVFYGNETGHLEIVRLSPTRFAVCFQRVSDATVICSLGLVLENTEAAGLRCTFGSTLQLGEGRLISVAPAAAGRQVVVCSVVTGLSDVTCRWADVIEPGEGAEDYELRLQGGAPRTVKTV